MAYQQDDHDGCLCSAKQSFRTLLKISNISINRVKQLCFSIYDIAIARVPVTEGRSETHMGGHSYPVPYIFRTRDQGHTVWFLVGVIFCEGRWCQITGGSKVVIPTL